MMLHLFLNELSCATEDCRAEDVELVMSGLHDTLREVGRHRRDFSLVADVGLFHVELAPGYPFSKWASTKQKTDPDKVRYIRRLADRAQYSDFSSIKLGDEVEYLHGEQPVKGLGYAHALDGLGVSLRFADTWNTHTVRLRRCALAEGADGRPVLVDEAVTARHAADSGHVGEHQGWLGATGLAQAQSGQDIWRLRSELFPHLDFLARVEDDLRRLQRSHVAPVKGLLHQLDRSMFRWNPSTSKAPVLPPNVTPEREQRKRLFLLTDSDGVRRSFDVHLRYTPDEGRVHFRTDHSNRKFVVGYIGKKVINKQLE